MDDETEFETIGDVQVPKAFATRWKELLDANRKLKVQVQESQAALTLAQEEAATGSTKELEKAQARIKELEADVETSAWSTALAEDGLGDDADTREYLQYQYGKVTPAEGESKASVKDWYQGFREKSTVVQAAKKAAASARKMATDTPKEAGGKEAPATNGTRVQASTRPVPPKTTQIPADSGGIDVNGLAGLDPREFAANRATLRKQLFGS